MQQAMVTAAILTTLLTGCAGTGIFATEQEAPQTALELCSVWREHRPSYSSRDTPQTLKEGRRVLAAMDGACSAIRP